MTVRLRIDLAYDGGPYSGFARQPGVTTVQGVLEEALARLVGQDVRTTAAGRTDRGVHALAQVVHLDVDPAVARAAPFLDDLEGFTERLDRLIGDPIMIWAVRRVPASFDARFSATQRRYNYRIAGQVPVPPMRRYDVLHVSEPLRMAPMRAAARHLVGEHDFASFCRRVEGKSTVRRIDSIAVASPASGWIEIRLRAPAFCHQQVRSIVGCLIEVGARRRPADWVAEVLAARDRAAAARVAPAHGLTLVGVSYGGRYPAAPPPDVR